MGPESKLEKSEHGLAPTGEGWYVLNMHDAEWRHAEGRGAVCVVADDFEGWRRESHQLGVNPFVLEPGEPMTLYHREAGQEDFLGVSGEAVLVVEGEERQLRAWDFVHCPLDAKHVIVGAGSGPCLVVAIGARAHDGQPDSIGFTVDDAAKRHGASVEEDTADGDVAYANVPGREPTADADGWLSQLAAARGAAGSSRAVARGVCDREHADRRGSRSRSGVRLVAVAHPLAHAPRRPGTIGSSSAHASAFVRAASRGR
jgi:uncharacterized cupin superfamily protein